MPERPPRASHLDAMLLAFRAHYEQGAPFREDRKLSEELASEVEPVFHALAVAYDPVVHPEHKHEGLTLLTLLARRAGELGATPTAALSLARALCEGLRASGAPVSRELDRELCTVVVEGYAAGRDERVTRELKRRALEGQVLRVLAPRCFLVCLFGAHDADDLTAVLDGFSRDLLRADAAACVVDVARLDLMHEECARAVVGFCAVNVSMGAHVVLSGASAVARPVLERVSLLESGVEIVDDPEQAIQRALSHAGLELKARRRWPKDFFARTRTNHRG